MTQRQVKLLPVGSIVALSLIVFISIFASTHNRVVTLEENIHTAQSNISKEEKRRVDLFNNLVDAVESYNKFERETFQQITEARSQANQGNVDEALLAIGVVVEAYPELKSQANYSKAMTEFSITENRIAQHREQYNNDIRGYNRKVRSFPTNIVLGVMGYEKQDFKYLEFDVAEDEHRGLFSN